MCLDIRKVNVVTKDSYPLNYTDDILCKLHHVKFIRAIGLETGLENRDYGRGDPLH
jgi:hypothetical protein